jgi:phage virion morphogenesis protein
MTGISYEVKGSEEALADLARAVAAFDDATPLYDNIGAGLVISTQERFETESGPDGSPWPQSIRVKFEGGKTLSDTRRLVGSLTHEANASGVAVGTNVIYAAIHQVGGVIKAKTSKGLRFRAGGNGGWVTKQSVTIPARPFLGLDDEDEAMISDIAGDYLEQAMAGAQ